MQPEALSALRDARREQAYRLLARTVAKATGLEPSESRSVATLLLTELTKAGLEIVWRKP